MPPLTAEQKKTRNKAWIGLVVAAGIIALALVWNRPSEKAVDFDLVCGQFIVPEKMTLNLNTAQAQVANANLYGFEANVSNILSGTLQADNGPEQQVRSSTITLAASPDQNVNVSNLAVTPSGKYANMELSADAGMTIISALQVGSPHSFTIEIPSQAAKAAHIFMQSGTARITGQRFRVGAPAPLVFMKYVKLTLTGQPLGTAIELKAGPTHQQQLRADIAFSNANEDIVMLGDESGKIVDLHDATLTFTRAFNPDLRIDGLKPKELITDHNVDLAIKLVSGKIQTLALVGLPAKGTTAGLHISGSAAASSVLQDGHELLPTWVEETLDKPYTERSTRLVILGVAAFLLFKVIDRALDLILKFFTPEG